MENSYPPEITRLLALKRYEVPPPGFPDYLRGRIMRAIGVEQQRSAQPWWARLFEEVTWQRGMFAANTLTLAGVAFLGAAIFHVAHSVVNEEAEGQVYAALPLPPEVTNRVAATPEDATNIAATEDLDSYLRPLPASGVAAPILPVFSVPTEPSDVDPPRWLFKSTSISNPRFILASERW